MGRYNTKQREAVLTCLASIDGNHVTAAEVAKHLGNKKVSVSRTTIYRHLESLTQSGEVRKYTINGIPGACFQYVGKNTACQEHFHLKCESCGVLYHLQCDTSNEFKKHISNNHDFEIDAIKTILYGICHDCLNGM